jgi:hypothetical protein
LKKTAAAAPLLPWRWRCGSGGGSGGAAMDISGARNLLDVHLEREYFSFCVCASVVCVCVLFSLLSS